MDGWMDGCFITGFRKRGTKPDGWTDRPSRNSTADQQEHHSVNSKLKTLAPRYLSKAIRIALLPLVNLHYNINT